MIQIPIGKGDHLAFLIGISPRLISAGGDAALIVLNNGLVLAGGHIPDPNHTLDINVFGFAVNELNNVHLCKGCLLGREPD